MKRFFQYINYFVSIKVTRLINRIFRCNAYKNLSEQANSDLSDASKHKLLPLLKKYQLSRPLGPANAICYAPTKSIYFGFGGKVVPCCFNREYIYGIYPETSISEIIEGSKRHKLQQKLHNHDFSEGCQHCRNQILNGNFIGVEARLYDKLKTKKNFPSEMIFELDNTCNLECTMCNGTFSTSILKNREHKPVYPSPYNDDFIKQLSPYLKQLQVAKFLGGEPFLIKSYYKIWEELINVNPNCCINLQTNGTIYNDKIEDLLKRGRFQIGISIDSLQKQRYEEIRKNASFEAVMENYHKFIKYTRKSGSFVNVSICPMLQNRDEIPELVNFCNSKNVFIYFNTVYSEGFSLQELNSTELKQIIEHYKSVPLIDNSYIAKRNNKFFYDLLNQLSDWQAIKYKNEMYLIPRYEFSKAKLLESIKLVLKNDFEFFEALLRESISDMPESLLLNDNQIQMLGQLDSNELKSILQNESKLQIKKRINNFISHSSFNYI